MPSVHQTFEIEGMTCGGCVRHVEAAFREVAGVIDVQVRLPEREARVTRDATRASVDDLISALSGAGYGARLRDQRRPPIENPSPKADR